MLNLFIFLVSCATYLCAVLLGCLIGCFIGNKIWDIYFENIILPKIRKEEYIKRLKFLEICKIIGNPIQEVKQ